METKFNKLMEILNNSEKERGLRMLFDTSNNLQKLQLIGTIQRFLGIEEKNIMQLFNDIVLESKQP